MTEPKQATPKWSTWVWALLLVGLVSCWVVWGALAYERVKPSSWLGLKVKRQRNVLRKGIQRLRWKRPNYRKFKTFRAAVVAARKARLPIFLDLYADWCVPCKKLEKETFSHPTVHPVMAKYLVVKFNVDYPEGKRLARRFRVRYYPTTLMLNSDGREVERVIGFYPARYYRPVLVSVLEGKGDYYNLISRNRRNPKDLGVMVALAKRSIMRRRVRQARRLYKRVLELDQNNNKGFAPKALFGVARTHSRVGQYSQALPYLKTFFKRFPQPGAVHREAMRLRMYALSRKRRYSERNQLMRTFRQLYPNASPKYK